MKNTYEAFLCRKFKSIASKKLIKIFKSMLDRKIDDQLKTNVTTNKLKFQMFL